MSKTLFVDFRGDGFWAFDVVTGVFLKHLIDAALQHQERAGAPWLEEAIDHWRFNAVVGDCGLYLNDAWSSEQVDTFTALVSTASRELARREQIPAEEVESWQVHAELRRGTRGLPAVSTASAIRLGQALIQLVNGTLPDPPPGTWWYFATEEASPTINKRR